MSLFNDQVCGVFPRRAVKKLPARADNIPVLLGESGNHSLRLGAHRFVVGLGEVDPICKCDGDRKQEIDLVLLAHHIDRHRLTDMLDHVFFRTRPGVSGSGREKSNSDNHNSAVENAHVDPPYYFRAQHDAEPADRQADHLTPFGARVPPPIAVPPRRSARLPDLTIAFCLSPQILRSRAVELAVLTPIVFALAYAIAARI